MERPLHASFTGDDICIRQTVQPEAINAATDRRRAPAEIADHCDALGCIAGDLFADATLLHDADLLDRLFREKLEEAAYVKAEERTWIDTLHGPYIAHDMGEELACLYRVEGDLTEEQAERCDEPAEPAQGEILHEAGEAGWDALHAILDGRFTGVQRGARGWFMCVAREGQIRMDGPYVRLEDRAATMAAEVLTGRGARQIEGGKNDAPKSPCNGVPVADLHAMRSAAVRGAMLDKPERALDLLVLTFTQAWGRPEPMPRRRPGSRRGCGTASGFPAGGGVAALPPASHHSHHPVARP